MPKTWPTFDAFHSAINTIAQRKFEEEQAEKEREFQLGLLQIQQEGAMDRAMLPYEHPQPPSPKEATQQEFYDYVASGGDPRKFGEGKLALAGIRLPDEPSPKDRALAEIERLGGEGKPIPDYLKMIGDVPISPSTPGPMGGFPKGTNTYLIRAEQIRDDIADREDEKRKAVETFETSGWRAYGFTKNSPGYNTKLDEIKKRYDDDIEYLRTQAQTLDNLGRAVGLEWFKHMPEQVDTTSQYPEDFLEYLFRPRLLPITPSPVDSLYEQEGLTPPRR
jgi:hypothetical protein